MDQVVVPQILLEGTWMTILSSLELFNLDRKAEESSKIYLINKKIEERIRTVDLLLATVLVLQAAAITTTPLRLDSLEQNAIVFCKCSA